MKADLLKKSKQRSVVTNDDIHNKLDKVLIGESDPAIIRRVGSKKLLRISLTVIAIIMISGVCLGIYMMRNKSEPPKQPAQQTPTEELKWSKVFEYNPEEHK